MKKIGIITVALLMIFQTVVFAADEPVVGPIVITYDDAAEVMLENNRELSSIQKQIEIQKEIIVEVQNESSRLDGFIKDDEDKITKRANAVYVDPIVAQNKLNALKRSYDDKVFELKQTLIDYYVNVVTKENQIKLYEEQKLIYQKEYDQKALELKLGKITDNDILTYEVNLDTVNKDLDNAKRDRELTQMDFNYLINNTLEIKYLPDTSNLDKVLVNNYIDLESINLKALIDKNIANDSTIASYKENIAKYEAQKRVEHIYVSSVSASKDYDQNIEDNQFDTDKQTKAIAYKVYTDYNTLKGLVLDIKIAQNNLELSQNAVDVVKVKSGLGMVTQLDLFKAEKDLTSSKNAVTEALNAYYKAYQAFIRFY